MCIILSKFKLHLDNIICNKHIIIGKLMLNIKQVENIIDTENDDNFISIKNLKNKQRALKKCPLDLKEPIYFPLDYFLNKDSKDIVNTKFAIKFRNEVAQIEDVDLHNVIAFITYDYKSTLILTTIGLSISKSEFITWNELNNIDFKDNKLSINNYTLNFDYIPNEWQIIEFVFLCKFLLNLIKTNEIPHNFKTEEELIVKTKEFEEFCKKARKDSFSTTVGGFLFISFAIFIIYNVITK